MTNQMFQTPSPEQHRNKDLALMQKTAERLGAPGPIRTGGLCLRREGAASVRRSNASPSAVDRGERAENKGRIDAICTGVAPGMVGQLISTPVAGSLS